MIIRLGKAITKNSYWCLLPKRCLSVIALIACDVWTSLRIDTNQIINRISWPWADERAMPVYTHDNTCEHKNGVLHYSSFALNYEYFSPPGYSFSLSNKGWRADRAHLLAIILFDALMRSSYHACCFVAMLVINWCPNQFWLVNTTQPQTAHFAPRWYTSPHRLYIRAFWKLVVPVPLLRLQKRNLRREQQAKEAKQTFRLQVLKPPSLAVQRGG